jgi:hypothetical protein
LAFKEATKIAGWPSICTLEIKQDSRRYALVDNRKESFFSRKSFAPLPNLTPAPTKSKRTSASEIADFRLKERERIAYSIPFESPVLLLQ